jgi:cytochrome c peroxidase
MRKVLVISFGLCCLLLFAFRSGNLQSLPLEWPADWPEPVYDFTQNPLSEEGFQLGRKLFYDPNLSRDSSVSCASCHLSFTGFAHVDHALSHGIEGRKGTRNAPALVNLIWQSSFHWDGGVNHLDAQAINPLQHPAEMDNSLNQVLAYLRRTPEYRKAFLVVFGDTAITTPRLMKAFSQFTTSLISANAKYDKVQRGEAEFTAQEANGHNLFQQHCAACHPAPLFQKNVFARNGLSLDSALQDQGRFAISRLPQDLYLFKVPTLRNIEHTFPYMHDGRFQTLTEVVRHYAHITPGSSEVSEALSQGVPLTPNAQKDLIAFLKTLTDKEFLYNPRYRYPMQQ